MDEDNGRPMLLPSTEIEDLLLAIVSVRGLVFFVLDHCAGVKSFEIDTENQKFVI